jgi:hypothetical protein
MRSALERTQRWLYETNPEDVADSWPVYPWLNAIHLRIFRDFGWAARPDYLWGALHGACLAKTLGMSSVSFIEFGVAGGNGLVSLEFIAKQVEQVFGIKVQVYGFDTGKGLPLPIDWRDCPNLDTEGEFVMDVAKLRGRLKSAELVLGDIKDTLPNFMANQSLAPVGFISVDVDYYSSARDALCLLNGRIDILLPRVHCYFDDVTGFTYAEFNGERLAIKEFNERHPLRQISPIFGVRHYVPKPFANELWVEKLFMAHILDHELYTYPEKKGLTRIPRHELLQRHLA